MIGGVHLEPLLAAGYAIFLFAVALGFELFGRYTHRRSGQFRTAGFKFHHQLDVWECPAGHHLHRHRHDREKRTIRYRAPAHTCNACSIKCHCTDSDQGREIVRSSVSWIESEARRFHRGISLVLLVLAMFILSVELVRYPTGTDRFILCAILVVTGGVVLRLLRGLRRTDSTSASSGE